MPPKRAIHEVERRIAAVAAAQHGVITFEQLLIAGLSPSSVRDRVRAGRLHRIHQGVYAVGHRGLGNEGLWMAAVLACGPGALLSHRSAAYLWNMLKPIPGPAHVTLPTRAGRRKRRGVTIHRSSTLLPSQIQAKASIPVTSPSRTLLDLRRIVSASEHRRAHRQAEFDGLPLDLPTDGTRSELESLFLKLLKRHRLPAPEVNARLGPFLIDFLWPEERLAAELDGYASHSGRQAFEDDRRRDVWLKLHGYEVVRFTYEQVTHRPAEVAAALRALLQRRAAG